MKWFKSKARQEIKELKAEIESLRADLHRRTEVRIGGWQGYSYGWTDPRPAVQLKDIVLLLTERLELEIKRTPEVPARTVIERRPETPNRTDGK